MKKIIYLLVLISIFLSCKGKTAKDTASEALLREYIIPFIMSNNQILLEGIFKDSAYYFILDNGAPITNLSQSVFNHYYNIAELTIPDAERRSPKCVLPIPVYIKFKDYDFLVDTILVFDASAFPKRSNFADLGGIIGVKLFQNNIIELNFEDSLMTIKDKLPENISEYQSFDLLPLKNRTQSFDYLLKQIEIPGFYDHEGNTFNGRFLLDLGSPSVPFTKTIGEKTNFDLSKKDSTTWAAFILNSRFTSLCTKFSDPSLTDEQNKQGFTINGQVMTADEYIEYKLGDGFLGVSFFSKFHVIFDYPHNKLYLKRNNLKYE